MQATLSREVLRREGPRLAKAAMVALAVQLLAAAFLAPAVADEGPAMPEQISLPEPREGDRAVYQVTGSAPFDRVTVAWTGTSWTPTQDGEWVRTRTLEMAFAGTPPSDGSSRAGWWIGPDKEVTARNVTLSVVVEASTWEPVAWSRKATETQVWNWIGTEDHHAEQTERVATRRTRYEDPRVPLGFLTELHRGPVPPNRTTQAVGVAPGGASVPMRPASVEEVQGASTVRYEVPGERATAWFSPGVPFPVQVAAPADRLLPGSSSDDRTRWVLAGFEQGSSSGPSSGARPPDLPSVETGLRRLWGPSNGTFEAPFRVEEAYRGLLDPDDPESTSAFLLEHPDAYVAEAALHRWNPQWSAEVVFDKHPEAEFPERLRPTWIWRFYLTDGDDGVERFVVLEGPRGSPTDPGDRTDVRRRGDLREPQRYPEPAKHHPAPDRVPDRLPLVGSLVDRYGRQLAQPAADRWRYETTCPTAGCEDVRTVVEVGGAEEHAYDPRRAARSQVETVRDLSASLRADEEGRVVQVATERRATQDGYRSSIQGDGGEHPSYPQATWTPDGLGSLGTAEQAGLLATLSGLLYYVWPKVKALGIGLYNRIGRDDALDNDTRQRILDLVREDPGIHFNELRDRLDLGGGALGHHLETLTDNGFLVVEDHEGYKCYFESGQVDPEVQAVAHRLRSEGARQVLKALESRPGSSLSALAEAADLSKSGAHYHLERLADADLVDRSRNGRATELALTGLGRRALDALNLG